jgi:hypothetical protein
VNKEDAVWRQDYSKRLTSFSRLRNRFALLCGRGSFCGLRDFKCESTQQWRLFCRSGPHRLGRGQSRYTHLFLSLQLLVVAFCRMSEPRTSSMFLPL